MENKMKRQWEQAELLKYFFLDDQDWQLLVGKAGATRLGFAVLLKFFQLEGRFPAAKNDIPLVVVSFLAEQLDISSQLYLQYDWQGRQISRHRSQIRHSFGFREATSQDTRTLQKWLVSEVLTQQTGLNQLKAKCYERLRALKIEPPADKPLERLIHSAMRQYEQQLVEKVYQQLSPVGRGKLDDLLKRPSLDRSGVLSVESVNETTLAEVDHLLWQDLKADPGGPRLDSLLEENAKLRWLQALALPARLFEGVAGSVLNQYRRRAATEELHELKRHPAPLRYTLIAAFCLQRQAEITDSLVELLISITHRIGTRAERRVSRQMLGELRRKNNKEKLLYQIARAVLANPDQPVSEVLFPLVGEQTFKELAQEAELQKGSGGSEGQSDENSYHYKLHHSMRESYRHHYRRMVAPVLEVLTFKADPTNPVLTSLLAALDFVRRSVTIEGAYLPLALPQENQQPAYTNGENQAVENEDAVVPLKWLEKRGQSGIVVKNEQGQPILDRLNFEMALLESLREKLRNREVWVEGAKRYHNPILDLPTPQEWEIHRLEYLTQLGQPSETQTFIQNLKTAMEKALDKTNREIVNNPKVKISVEGRGSIILSPLQADPEPLNLQKLKNQLSYRWPMTGLLDVLKETALRTGFLDEFRTATVRENLDEPTLHKRLLLCLYALGTNIGLKAVSAGDHGQHYRDLLYVRHRYMLRDHLRSAISRVTNATFQARLSSVWGEATSACASDSTKFGAVDQNLLTQWHNRYGGPGVMAYWHVERKAVCIYSQLKSCSSSEVASMLEGILRHLSEMEVHKNYVDTHGQSEIAFAFSHLLGFELLPRLKNLSVQKLYKPYAIILGKWGHLNPIMERPIRWELIAEQYEEILKYVMALKQGRTSAENLLRPFARTGGSQHPLYQALLELGRAVKTIFLCRYLNEESLRREIQQGLNIVECWNAINDFIFYGRSGEFTSNRLEDQEISLLCLHLLQNSLVYINTLLIQRVLAEREWLAQMKAEDWRALSPLVHQHINPYGNFQLKMEERLPIEAGGNAMLVAAQ